MSKQVQGKHSTHLGLDALAEDGQGVGKIRGEGAVDVGLELVEVNVDQLVVLALCSEGRAVRAQLVLWPWCLC